MSMISAEALEKMRQALKQVDPDSASIQENELLTATRCVVNGNLTVGGLLLAGHEQSLQQILPGLGWSYQYAPFGRETLDMQQGHGNILESVDRLLALILKHTPVFTTQRKDRRVEIYPYPISALQEALWNAFIHQDLQSGTQIQVYHTTDFVQITNSGRLPEGVNSTNLLHAPRRARNPHLIQILKSLNLVGHDTQGIEKMVWAMLAEGKESPTFEEIDQQVRVTFSGWAGFVLWPVFVEEETTLGNVLSVDHLLLMRRLLLIADVDIATAAEICQRSEPEAHQLLIEMTGQGYLLHNYVNKEEIWSLQPKMFDRITSEWGLIRQRQMYYADLQKRFVEVLSGRAHTSNPYIANPEISKLLRIRRQQVHRFMDDVMKAYPEIEAVGKKRWTQYRLRETYHA